MTKSYNWTPEMMRTVLCEEVGKCWEWKGAINSGGHPAMTYQGVGGVLARRLAFCLSKGLCLDDIKGLRVWNTCQNQLCINPACSKMGLSSQMFTEMKGQGRFKASPKKRAASARAKRAASNLSMDDVRAIRTAVESGAKRKDMAVQYQKSVSMIDRIVTGQSWKEAVAGASVFVGVI